MFLSSLDLLFIRPWACTRAVSLIRFEAAVAVLLVLPSRPRRPRTVPCSPKQYRRAADFRTPGTPLAVRHGCCHGRFNPFIKHTRYAPQRADLIVPINCVG